MQTQVRTSGRASRRACRQSLIAGAAGAWSRVRVGATAPTHQNPPHPRHTHVTPPPPPPPTTNTGRRALLYPQPFPAFPAPQGTWNPVLEHPVLLQIATTHRKTPAQVALRWALQHGQVGDAGGGGRAGAPLRPGVGSLLSKYRKIVFYS